MTFFTNEKIQGGILKISYRLVYLFYGISIVFVVGQAKQGFVLNHRSHIVGDQFLPARFTSLYLIQNTIGGDVHVIFIVIAYIFNFIIDHQILKQRP